MAARSAAASPSPVPSVTTLTTGNGYGFQVFSVDQKKLTQFLERPYRYLRPGATQMASGVERRNLAYDVYFGLRAGSTGTWLKDLPQAEVGYVAQTGIIRSSAWVGAVKAESYYFSPFGYPGNALIVLLHVTNTGGTPTTVDAFLNPNFHLGAGTGDMPGAESETIATSGSSSVETGPGGGAVIYQPIGGFDRADCSGTGYGRVMSGMDLMGAPQSCSNQNDVTIVYQKSLGAVAAGTDAWWGAAIQFAPDASGAGAAVGAMSAWTQGRSPAQLLLDAETEWEAWRRPPPAGLSSNERAVYRQAEAVLRMAQVREGWSAVPKQKGLGMILASLPPGQWHIGWVRDAQYATVALARSGHLAEAKLALQFFIDAEANRYQSYVGAPYRISVTRYFGDGQEESDWNPAGPNVELDGWGLYLWAARSYIDASGDTGWLSTQTRAGETLYDVLRDQIAGPLDRSREPSGLIAADTSIWESHWNNRKHYAYTSLAAARGLCDFASLATRKGDAATAAAYQKASEQIRIGVRAHLVDAQLALAGSQEGLAAGRYHDAAVIEALNWDLFGAADPVTGATLDALAPLQVASGGYMRNDDALSSYDSNEWVVVDLRASTAFRRAGRTGRADDLLAWVTAQAVANLNLIPELYNTFSVNGPVGAYAGAIPMVGFGAAAYILTLLDRAGAALPNTGCDSAVLDGGSPPPTDGGVADASSPTDGLADGLLGAVDRGATHPTARRGGCDGGCGCGGGQARSMPPWLLLALVGATVFLIRRRR